MSLKKQLKSEVKAEKESVDKEVEAIRNMLIQVSLLFPQTIIIGYNHAKVVPSYRMATSI